jgi:hypothetical protein
MSNHRPRRSLDRALAAVRAHFRETGQPPSLSDLARRLGCSRQRACVLVAELAKRGAIGRTPGAAFSIRLIEEDPAAMISDGAILHEVLSRGLLEPGTISAALRAAYPMEPLTTLQLTGGRALRQLLAGLDGVSEAAGGKIGSKAGEEGATR